MKITSAKYCKFPSTNENDIILANIDGVTMCVPIDSDNTHFQAIQTWVADGNTIDSAD